MSTGGGREVVYSVNTPLLTRLLKTGYHSTTFGVPPEAFFVSGPGLRLIRVRLGFYN